MSINHCPSQLTEPFWCTTKQHYIMESTKKSSYLCSNSNQLEENEIPKEHLFEKPLTPSDVGKLNRLVIPKQHAEKHFPLNGTQNDSGEKGFLLNFEDELGKLWTFRYSYWNSSQSYVLTKGWSRFVKEKKLDAGDFVLFERHRLDGDRTFIGWRRRNAATGATALEQESGVAPTGGGGGGGWGQVYYGGSGHPYPSAGVPYQPDCLHAGRRGMHNQIVANGNNTRRQVRLFGVNLAECDIDESSWSEPSTSDGSSTPSHHQQSQEYQGQSGPSYYQYQVHCSNPPAASSYAKNDHHNNMDVDYSSDINQMRYHQG